MDTVLKRLIPKPVRSALVGIVLLAMNGPHASSRGAEFRLARECRPAGRIVTLGDVADVVAADGTQADRLGRVELFPAPPPGEKKFSEAREIQDILLIHGVNLAEHRFSGSSRVTVFSPRPADPDVAPRRLPESIKRSAEARVRQALLNYLRQNVSDNDCWDVEVTLEDLQVRTVMATRAEMLVRGGIPPWTGSQRFQLEVDTPEGSEQLFVNAQVTLPPVVAVAATQLHRGTVIRDQDVTFQRAQSLITGDDPLHSPEEVVGTETLRTIPAGAVIRRGFVRRPVCVRRGEEITVHARCGGIQVTTLARAKQDGSLGDAVAVEAPEGRKVYFARVIGVREAQVSTPALHPRALPPAEVGPALSLSDGLGPRGAPDFRAHTNRAVRLPGYGTVGQTPGLDRLRIGQSSAQLAPPRDGSGVNSRVRNPGWYGTPNAAGPPLLRPTVDSSRRADYPDPKPSAIHR